MPIKWWLFSPFVILTAVNPALSLDTFELNEIVVTGTRTEKRLLDSPVRTEIVTHSEIERHHARDLKEALKHVPGLLLKPNRKNGFEAWMQGFDSDRVLVVLNGEPLTPSTGSTIDLSQIGSLNIERVEIVKGATSALYGSSAMGGIINIITKKPERPLVYNLTLDSGSFNDHNLGQSSNPARHTVAGHVSTQQPFWSFSGTASLRHNEGFDLDKDTLAYEGARGDKANLDVRLAYTPNENTEFYFAPRYYYENINHNMDAFAPGIGEIKRIQREEAERFHTTLGTEIDGKDGRRFRAWLVTDIWNDMTEQDVPSTPQVEQQRDADIKLYRAELQWDQPAGDRHLITTGVLAGHTTLNQSQSGRSSEVDNADKQNFEAYIQDDIFVNARWQLIPGIRIQEDSDFGFKTTPKINAMYSPNWISNITTNIRIGYGKGYRVPNLKERFFRFDHSALGYIILGNKDLQPEQSDSYQLGIEFAHADRFHFDISLFHNRAKKLIDTDLREIEDGIQIFRFINIDRAQTQGVETSLKYRFSSLFDMKTSVSWLDGEDKRSGQRLPELPEWVVKLALDYQLPSWRTRISLLGTHQSEEYNNLSHTSKTPAWTTWDIKINQPLSRKFSLFAGIDNITNEHRDPHKPGEDFRPLEPRFIYAGIRYGNQ